MGPNYRPPNHYSRVDDWKNEAKEGSVYEERTPRDDFRGSTRRTIPDCDHIAGGGHETGRRETHTSNCCRTTHDVPYGSHFPIGETLESTGVWRPAQKPVKHLEYGYQASWRSCRAVIPITDIIKPCTVTPADAGFRPSKKVFKLGTGAWSEKWKASKRYIESSCGKDQQWRSSVRTSYPHRRGHEEEYRPQVRPDPVNSTLETNEGHFRPVRRYIVPYTPLRSKAPYQQKRHIIVPNEWVPPFRLQGEDYNSIPPKQFGKARVQNYFTTREPLCLAWDAPNLPGSVELAPDSRPVSRQDGKKYNPTGHLSHFETLNCCICKVNEEDIGRRTLRNHSACGSRHQTVAERDPIAGHLPETDVFREGRVTRGPALYGPAGSINSAIIDHKFSKGVQMTPVSEMKDQYRYRKMQEDQ